MVECLLMLCLKDKEDDVLKRDFSAPTLEDHFNKTVLPKVMQVVWQSVIFQYRYHMLSDANMLLQLYLDI